MTEESNQEESMTFTMLTEYRNLHVPPTMMNNYTSSLPDFYMKYADKCTDDDDLYTILQEYNEKGEIYVAKLGQFSDCESVKYNYFPKDTDGRYVIPEQLMTITTRHHGIQKTYHGNVILYINKNAEEGYLPHGDGKFSYCDDEPVEIVGKFRFGYCTEGTLLVGNKKLELYYGQIVEELEDNSIVSESIMDLENEESMDLMTTEEMENEVAQYFRLSNGANGIIFGEASHPGPRPSTIVLVMDDCVRTFMKVIVLTFGIVCTYYLLCTFLLYAYFRLSNGANGIIFGEASHPGPTPSKSSFKANMKPIKIRANGINTLFTENFIARKKFRRTYRGIHGGGRVCTVADDDEDKYHAVFSGTTLTTRQDNQLLCRHGKFKLYGTYLTFNDGGFTTDITSRRLNALMQTIHGETSEVTELWKTLIDDTREVISAIFEKEEKEVPHIVEIILQFCGPVKLPLSRHSTRVKRGIRTPTFKLNQYVMQNSLHLEC